VKAAAKANTNIALIKYWGKRNEELFLPMNSSISITLDRFYTITSVEFSKSFVEDVFILNGVKANEEDTTKISRFLDRVRNLARTNLRAMVSFG
jgi:diphosphomevalonate decarboxylase (EC 4.1.1.33)